LRWLFYGVTGGMEYVGGRFMCIFDYLNAI
jgi:hypothetical protein